MSEPLRAVSRSTGQTPPATVLAAVPQVAREQAEASAPAAATPPAVRPDAGFDPTGRLKFQEPTARATGSNDFSDHARALFDRIDDDDNGYLSDGELNDALHDSSFRGADAGAVVALHRMVDDLEELSNDEWGDENDGVTLADLTAYDNLTVADGTHTDVESYYDSAQSHASQTSRQLFPNGRASIVPEAIHQGFLGDCYFLAGVAGLARTNPAAIERMIQDNGNGTYTVTFPGRRAVTVAAPTDAEIGRGTYGGRYGTWPTVLEKAYARLEDSAMDYEEIEGGDTEDGIDLLTGDANSYSFGMLSLFGEDFVAQQIQLAMAANQVITMGTPGSGKKLSNNGIVTSHVYTVVGFDAQTRMVTLRNPWGTDGPNGDGLHQVPLSTIMASFDDMGIQD